MGRFGGELHRLVVERFGCARHVDGLAGGPGCRLGRQFGGGGEPPGAFPQHSHAEARRLLLGRPFQVSVADPDRGVPGPGHPHLGVTGPLLAGQAQGGIGEGVEREPEEGVVHRRFGFTTRHESHPPVGHSAPRHGQVDPPKGAHLPDGLLEALY
jgi:hypothetical protein